MKGVIVSSIRSSFILILLINIFLNVGCTLKSTRSIPKTSFDDFEKVRSLTAEEMAENAKVLRDYDKKEEIIEEIKVTEIAKKEALIRKYDEPEPKPKKKVVLQKVAVPTYKTPVIKPKVVEPKIAKKPTVNTTPTKAQAIIIPTGSLGEIKISRIKILEKTLESKLDDYFAIVPKNLYEEAKEKAWEELEQ